MARKLYYNAEEKFTFMRENALKRGMCMNCKRNGYIFQLYKYWKEKDIGGDDRADQHALPFCGVDCYRAYYPDQVRALKNKELV